MSKIAILGANSYIGRNFISYLKSRHLNEELVLYGHSDIQLDLYDNYKKIEFDKFDSIDLIDWSVDYIYIFFGKTGTLNGFSEYDLFIDINEKYLLHFLTQYIKNKCKAKLIFLSSRLVYKGSKYPLKEDDEKEFKTIYAMNKFACENYLKMYHNMYNIPYVILRLCVPYGSYSVANLSYGLMNFFITKAQNGEDINIFGDGSQKRTLTNMDYLVQILWEVAKNNKILNDTFNIGGEVLSLKEIAEKIANKYNVGINFVDCSRESLIIESGDTVFNSNKLDTLLDFKYNYKIDDYLNLLN